MQPSLIVSNLGSFDTSCLHRADHIPSEIKVVYLRCTGGEVSALSAPVPWVCLPKSLVMTSPKQPVFGGSEDYSETDPSERRPRMRQCFLLLPIIKALKEPPRDRKKQKIIQQEML